MSRKDSTGEPPEVAIVGLGPIGASEAIYLIASGRRCIGVDVSRTAIERAQDAGTLAKLTDLSLDRIQACLKSFRTTATLDDLPASLSTFVICVPTELDGQPSFSILEDVVTSILRRSRSNNVEPRILVESTVSPGWYAQVAVPLLKKSFGADALSKVHYGYSPRRDWFLSSERANRGVFRVLSAGSEEALLYFERLLRASWPNLVSTTMVAETEVAKAFENAVRYVGISFAHEVARSFPSIDIDHAFELAGSKWNIERYFNSLGVGGYCTPTAARYLSMSPLCARPLQFAELADDVGRAQIQDCVSFIKHHSVQRIGIVGLRYRPPFRSAVESAAMRLAMALHQSKVEVFAFDSMLFDGTATHSFLQRLTPEHTDLDAVLLHVVSTDEEQSLASQLTSRDGILIIDNREDQRSLHLSGERYFSTRNTIFSANI
jgi:nucleotide sugar dehydrogenase